MAKKPRKPTRRAAAPTVPKDIVGQIGANALKDLLKDARTASKKQTEISLAFSKKKAKAIEEMHLKPRVFAEIARLDRMEPEELAEHLSVRDYYMDISGLTERAASVNRLPMGDEHGERDETETEAAAETPTPRRRRGAAAPVEGGAEVHRPQFGRGRRRGAQPATEAAE